MAADPEKLRQLIRNFLYNDDDDMESELAEYLDTHNTTASIGNHIWKGVKDDKGFWVIKHVCPPNTCQKKGP